jgi:hypothetical protein
MFIRIIWDLEDDPEGNVQKIIEHDLTTDEVEEVLLNPDNETRSRSSGLPASFGYASTGQYIMVIYEIVDEDAVKPITAFPVPEP